LFKPVYDYFKKKGFKVRGEIKIGFHRADLVAFKDEVVIAVELKLRDWKKAVIQAKNYQFGSDFVYIAVPLLKSYNILRKAEHIFKKEGIGLLVVNEKDSRVKEIIEPKLSTRKIGGNINLKR
jgi:hypothetical protein